MKNIERTRNMKKAIVALACVTAIGVAGVSAYFTDTHTIVNSFTIGQIKQQLDEPNFNPDDAKDIVPNKVITKDPTVTNTGANDQYVFMSVEVPYDTDIPQLNDNGYIEKAAGSGPVELFTYATNDGWVLFNTVDDADTETITRYYYWGADGQLATLSPQEATNPLFDSVKFVNTAEGYWQYDDMGLINEESIVVKSYGIQDSYLDGTNGSPEGVFGLIQRNNTENLGN